MSTAGRLALIVSAVVVIATVPCTQSVAGQPISSSVGSPTALGAGTGSVHEPAAEPEARSRDRVAAALGHLPLYFVENQGQINSSVAYYVQGRDTTLYFTHRGLTLALTGPAADPNLSADLVQTVAFRSESASKDPQPASRQRWTVKLDFIGATAGVAPQGQDETDALISYFKGPGDQWKTGLSTYTSVVYKDLWPGIDLVYTGIANGLEYTFYIQPGADPNQIRLAYRGTTGVTLADEGTLQITTPVSDFTDASPVSYQEIGGRRLPVETAYVLDPEAVYGVYTYGFQLGTYDRTQPLILDPTIFVYAGYIGGSGFDLGNAIAVDGTGAAYVTGQTSSTEADFPVTVGPDLTQNGGADAFVVKVNPAGTALVYAGYIGGSTTSPELGNGIAVDGSGAAYITGSTSATEATFPVTVGPDLTQNGAEDAFVAKVNPAGTALVYAGYIGGSFSDRGRSIAVDATGAAYVTGETSSTEATFPVTVGPDLTFNLPTSSSDAFVAKVNPAGTALVYAGYIGGSFVGGIGGGNGVDGGLGIAVDATGAAYVTGNTSSTEATFPVTVGPDLTYNGGIDAFVAKVNPAGTALVYASYIGGSGTDTSLGIAVDATGASYISGATGSTAATFPVTGGPDLTYNGGALDAYVAKINPAGTALVYAGYIGGSTSDSGQSIAVDGTGAAYITGSTSSTQTTFPETDGPDLTHNGGIDAFVAKVNPAGTALVYAGYIGGSGTDSGLGIAVDGSGNAYIAGRTDSTEATFPETVGPDLTQNGSTDAFVAKITDAPIAVELQSFQID